MATTSKSSTPTNTPNIASGFDTDESVKLLDVYRNGIKIRTVPDVVPVEFNNDDECREFVLELKKLPNLSSKHLRMLDSCLTLLSRNVAEKISFGPSEILVFSELAFRYHEKGQRIMSLLKYLMSCLDFSGTIPEGFFGEVASTFAYLGSLPGKEDSEGNDLDNDEQFGFDLGESGQSDEDYDDDVHSDDE